MDGQTDERHHSVRETEDHGPLISTDIHVSALFSFLLPPLPPPCPLFNQETVEEDFPSITEPLVWSSVDENMKRYK